MNFLTLVHKYLMLEVTLNIRKSAQLRLYLVLFSNELENSFYSEFSWEPLPKHQVGKQKARKQ